MKTIRLKLSFPAVLMLRKDAVPKMKDMMFQVINNEMQVQVENYKQQV